jgi:hypothetical protein
MINQPRMFLSKQFLYDMLYTDSSSSQGIFNYYIEILTTSNRGVSTFFILHMLPPSLHFLNQILYITKPSLHAYRGP